MYKILGWVNFAAVIIMFLPIMMQKLNTQKFNQKNNIYVRFLRNIRKLHKPIGIILFVSALIHGFLALGALRLHTGSLLGLLLVITGIFAFLFYKLKKKWLFVTHKILAYLLVILMIVHLVYPSAVYYLFGI